MRKRILTVIMTAVMTLSMTIPAFAGQWQQSSGRWWYQRDDGSYPANAWELIDGSYYHFDANGYMETGWYLEIDKSLSDYWQVTGAYYLDPATGKMATNTVIHDKHPEFDYTEAYAIGADGNCMDRADDMQEIIEDQNFDYVTENTDYMGLWWSGEWQRRYGNGQSNDISDDQLEQQMTYDEDDVLEQQMTYDEDDVLEQQMTHDEDDVLEWQTYGDQGFDY